MEGQAVTASALSAVLKSVQLGHGDWHGFCLGFGTEHPGWALQL